MTWEIENLIRRYKQSKFVFPATVKTNALYALPYHLPQAFHWDDKNHLTSVSVMIFTRMSTGCCQRKCQKLCFIRVNLLPICIFCNSSWFVTSQIENPIRRQKVKSCAEAMMSKQFCTRQADPRFKVVHHCVCWTTWTPAVESLVSMWRSLIRPSYHGSSCHTD